MTSRKLLSNPSKTMNASKGHQNAVHKHCKDDGVGLFLRFAPYWLLLKGVFLVCPRILKTNSWGCCGRQPRELDQARQFELPDELCKTLSVFHHNVLTYIGEHSLVSNPSQASRIRLKEQTQGAETCCQAHNINSSQRQQLTGENEHEDALKEHNPNSALPVRRSPGTEEGKA